MIETNPRVKNAQLQTIIDLIRHAAATGVVVISSIVMKILIKYLFNH